MSVIGDTGDTGEIDGAPGTAGARERVDMALEAALRELLAASMDAERARLEALRRWASFWMQQPDEAEARKAWASVAGPELSHFFVCMSREDARYVLELLHRWDEPEHNAQERKNMIQELRAVGLQQPPG